MRAMTGETHDMVLTATHITIPTPQSATGYEPAPALTRLAGELVSEYPELSDAARFTLKCLWKHKGGKNLGKCVKVSDLAGHFAGVDYVVWLAIDNVQGAQFSDQQITALLFHELRHIQEKVDKDGELTGQPMIRQHDIEEFADVVERFGVWRSDHLAFAAATHAAYSQGRLL